MSDFDTCIILLGGQGTRLRPLTYFRHKSLVPLAGEPFLNHVLRWLAANGVREARLALGSFETSHQLAGAFPEGSHLGVSVRHVFEDEPLDSGGAIRHAAGGVRSTFLVLNGDIFTDLDLSTMLAGHRKREAIISIALTPVVETWNYGVIETDPGGKILSFVEKPPKGEERSNLVNAGVWLFEPEALERLPAGRSSVERFLFPTLVEEGKTLYGHRFEGAWVDIGMPRRYLDLNLALAGDGLRAPPSARVHGSAHVSGPALLGERVEIGPDAVLAGGCVIGDGSSVGRAAAIEGSLLWEDVVVGEEAVVRASILGRGVRVGRGARLSGCVLGDEVSVEPGTEVPAGTSIDPPALSGRG